MKRFILIVIVLAMLISGCGTGEVRNAETKEVTCSFMLMPWHFFDLDGTYERKCGIEISD